MTQVSDKRLIISKENLKGNWYLNEWTSYHTLVFGDSTLFIDFDVDTCLNMTYDVSHDTLVMYDRNTDKVFRNKIKSITKDSLVLDGIMESKEIGPYSRTEKRK